jgi:hypothetical protein
MTEHIVFENEDFSICFVNLYICKCVCRRNIGYVDKVSAIIHYMAPNVGQL